MDNPQATILNTGSETKQSPDQSQVDSSPAVTFESITFSDGTTVTLDPNPPMDRDGRREDSGSG